MATSATGRRFSFDPFSQYDQYRDPFSGTIMQGYDPSSGAVLGAEGDSSVYRDALKENAWSLSDDLKSADPWLYENWGNPDNMTVVSKDPDGSYIVRVKSADKEGTLYRFSPDGQGGYYENGEVGTEKWDTNAAQKRDLIGLGSVALAALGGYGAEKLGMVGGGATSGGLVGPPIEAAGGAAMGPPISAAGGAAMGPPAWAAGGGEALGAGWVGEAAGGLTGTELGAGWVGEASAGGAIPGAGSSWAGTGAAAAGTGASTVATKAGQSALVKALMDAGLSEGWATALITAAPALLALGSDALSGPDEVKRTGNPTINAAQEDLAKRVTGRMDEGMARDRERSDQLAAWSQAAGGVAGRAPSYQGLFSTGPTGRPAFRKPGLMWDPATRTWR